MSRLNGARMFTIGGGAARVSRTPVAGRLLDREAPRTRDGYRNLAR